MCRGRVHLGISVSSLQFSVNLKLLKKKIKSIKKATRFINQFYLEGSPYSNEYGLKANLRTSLFQSLEFTIYICHFIDI